MIISFFIIHNVFEILPFFLRGKKNFTSNYEVTWKKKNLPLINVARKITDSG